MSARGSCGAARIGALAALKRGIGAASCVALIIIIGGGSAERRRKQMA